MNVKSTTQQLRKKTKTDMHKLQSKQDSDIDYSDIAETTEDFWKNAKVVLPTKKVPLSLRIDEDIIDWFKHKGRGYQTKINAVLRAYVNSKKKRAA